MSDVPDGPDPVIEVATPIGPGRLFVALARQPVATLVLGHGAGEGVDSADLHRLAQRLPALGVTVVRFEQPWRTAGRRVAVAPPQLDIGWRAAMEHLDRQPWATGRLLVGGRSAGARVACRTANDFGVSGVVCLAFPLHLPGKPERSRLPELLTPSAPRLVLQGSNDAFGGALELAGALTAAEANGVSLVELPGADHSFRVAKGGSPTAAELGNLVCDLVAAFASAGNIPSTPLLYGA